MKLYRIFDTNKDYDYRRFFIEDYILSISEMFFNNKELYEFSKEDIYTKYIENYNSNISTKIEKLILINFEEYKERIIDADSEYFGEIIFFDDPKIECILINDEIIYFEFNHYYHDEYGEITNIRQQLFAFDLNDKITILDSNYCLYDDSGIFVDSYEYWFWNEELEKIINS